MVIAKKLTPYSRMIQKVAANLSSKADKGASAELVAKVILEAVTSKEPNLRYLANKRTMSDTEFRNMIGKMA